MDMEDSENFCKNCKRKISAANFALHSAFCERNIFVCKICDEPVPISQKDQHIEDYHVIFPCDLCKVPIEKWMLPKHMEVCPKRNVVCIYCDADLPLEKYSEHVEFCGSRTEKCLLCQKYIMMKDKCKHDEFHEEIKQNKVNEVISKRETSRERSEKTSGSSVNTISEGGNMNFSDKAESKIDREDKNLRFSRRNENLYHEGAASSSKTQISKHFTECHICKNPIPWIDYNMHVPNCASSAGKCAVCGDDVPGNLIKEHMMKHVQDRSENKSLKVSKSYESYYETSCRSYPSDCAKNEIKCPYCPLTFSEDQILEHTRNCPRNTYECKLCNVTVQERHRTQHETSECRIVHENSAYDESYFSRSYHQSFFECPLCAKQMPEKDRDKHTSFECEQLLQIGDASGLYAVGEDSYECPLCAEKMPLKDRDKHQSFYCRVLIESNSPSSLNSYAEVTKKTCHKKCNCKCCQQSEICPTCKSKFPKDKISEHKNGCGRIKVPCQLCNEMIDSTCEDVHLKYCPALISDEIYTGSKTKADHNSRISNYGHKEMPKKSSIQDMMKPRSAKCKYCRTAYNVDILPNHEKECVHMPIECSVCFRDILLMNMNTHKCKRRKSKGKHRALDQPDSEEDCENSLWARTKKKLFSFADEKREVKSEQPQSYYTGYGWERERNDEKLYFERTDDTLLPCEFCQKEFPASELVLHETGCQPDLVSYARPNMPKKLEPNKSWSRQDYAKKDTIHASESESIHVSGARSGVANPFFAKNNSILQKGTSDHIKCDQRRKSKDKAGEFLPLNYNASSSYFENSAKENIGVEKKDVPLSYQSVWNAESPSFLREDHYLKENVKDSNINKVEKYNELKKRKMDVSEKLDLPDDTHLQSDDEMTAVVKDGGSESDEFVSLSDDNEEPEKSEMKGYDSLNSKDNKNEKQEDLTESKNMAKDGKSKEDFPKTLDLDCRGNAEKHQEYSRYLGDFRLGAYGTSLFSKNNEHYAIQSKKTYEDLQTSSKCFERSLNQKEQENSFRDQTKSKLIEYQPGAFSKYQLRAFSVDNCVSGENDEEAEKLLLKHKATKFYESSNNQTGYTNNSKHMSDFKLCTGEALASSVSENACSPVKGAKNSYLEQLHEQNVQKSDSTNEAKVNFSYWKYSTTFSDEKLQEKYNKKLETLNYEKNPDSIDTPVDNMDYIRNCKQYLPGFKFGVLKTNRKSSDANVSNENLHESRSGDHQKQAFMLKPDFKKLGSFETSRKSSEFDSNEMKVSNKNLHESRSGHHQKQAFMLETAESLKESHSSLYANVKKEKALGLEEKIAALQRDNKKSLSVTDDENNDVSKWNKYRAKNSYDSSDCSD